jgi:hypothetical protein
MGGWVYDDDEVLPLVKGRDRTRESSLVLENSHERKEKFIMKCALFSS